MSLLYLMGVISTTSFIIAIGCCIFVLVWVFHSKRHYASVRNKSDKAVIKVAFFHPYCNAGGGGERVLWCAIQALYNTYPLINVVVYTGDVDASPSDIIRRAEERFNIKLPESIDFIYLYNRSLVEAKRYKRFTLLCQNFFSIFLGIEALKAYLPDIFIDTMGYPFILPVFKFIGGCRTASYIHYPIITSEMIKKVAYRQVSYNNQRYVARNPFLTSAKVLYYKLFAKCYRLTGLFSDIVMVNSSWTEEHINSLWFCEATTQRIYPPCDTSDLQKIPMNAGQSNKIKIISVAQFRPEKDHPLQLKAMYYLRQIVREEVWDKVELVLIGSTRNEEDEVRVQDMKDLCRHLSLENNVSFKVNIPYSELKKEFQEGLIGIHTMWNEHFGISVVECMAAGLIMIAHKSGGPEMDIIEEAQSSRNGFLALNEVDYAQTIDIILRMTDNARNKIRQSARSSVNRFSTSEFQKNFLRATKPLFDNNRLQTLTS